MSDVAERRLTGMLATPHLLMSCFSQYYFLRGVKVCLHLVCTLSVLGETVHPAV